MNPQSQTAEIPFFQSIAVPLAERGMKVIPVRGKIAFINNHPAEATTDIVKIKNEWKQYGDCNAAVMCIQEHGGTVILDDDGKVDLAALYTAETGKPAPETRRIVNRDIAPGQPFRSHWLFRQTNDTMALPNNIVESTTNGEFSLRVKNFYALAEGSLHPDHGGIYRAVSDVPIVPMPNDFLEWLLRRSSANKKPIDMRSTDRISRGQHDVTLTAIAGRLRRDGLEEESLYNALVEICEKRCDDYGNDYKQMARKIAHSIAKKPVGDDGVPYFGSQVASNPVMPVDISTWREQFRSVAEMEEGDPVMVITGVLQEGTCIIGAVPGECKTLIGVAMSKSISDGTPLFGLPAFSVPMRRPVIYLIPETRDRAFRKRCEAFKITQDKSWFMARTLSSGAPLQLTDLYLLEAVRQTKPVVFLDTAIRFMRSNDENASAQNRELYNDVTTLLVAGAVLVVLVHHATKASKKEKMSLENMVRGSGDLAAMCDQVYGVQRDNTLYENGAGPLEIVIDNLKDREDTTGLTSLRLAASYKASPFSVPTSCIDETGNFKVVDAGETLQRNHDVIVRAVQIDSNRPAKDIAHAIGQTEYSVKKVLKAAGYHSVQGGKSGSSPWHKDDGKPCPYAKEPGKTVKMDLEPSKPVDRIRIGEAVEFLEAFLTSEVPAKDVYSRADKIGIPDKLVNRAAKRLGVKIKDGIFSKVPQSDVIPDQSVGPRPVVN